MQKYTIYNLGLETDIDNDICEIKINHTLNKLLITCTKLYRGRSIECVVPDGQEQIVSFIQGTGVVVVTNQTYRVNVGSVLLLSANTLYEVVNDGEMNLLYNTIVGN